MVKIVLLCCGFFSFQTSSSTYFLSILNSRDMFGCLDSQTNVKRSFSCIFFAFFFFYIYVFNLSKSEDDFTNDNYVTLKIMYSASGQKLYIRN